MRAREITQYNQLTWPEMNDVIELQKVVLLPTGSTEQHGAHLPLDTDDCVSVELRSSRVSRP